VSEAVQNILSSRLFTTRAGTIAVGAFVALLALLVLLVYLSNYRSSVRASSASTPVLVSTRLIPQGTSWDVIGQSHGFQATDVPRNNLKTGAVADPAIMQGRVALHDIFPNQQLTIADFTPVATADLGSRLTGKQRAISIPVDTVHGMIGTIAAGNKVDIFVGFNQGTAMVKAIMQDVLVLGIGASAGGGVGSGTGGASSVTLRASPLQASQLAYASENGTIWLVLRPSSGARVTGPSVVTAASLLLGKKKVPVGG
jgi:Flp pilus assembly protein CpaB